MSWSLRTTKTREEPGAASPPPARSDPVRAQPPARGRPAAGRSSAGTRDPPPRSNRVSHTSTSAGPHSKHSCLEAGSAPGTTCGRGRWGRQGEPGTPGTPLPIPPGPPRSPHHQRRLHVHLLHAPNRARLPLSRRPRRGCPSRCLPPPAGARPRLLLSAAARGEAPGGLPPPPGPHRGSSAGLGAGAGGARPGCAEGSARPRRGGSGLRGGEAGLRGGGRAEGSFRSRLPPALLQSWGRLDPPSAEEHEEPGEAPLLRSPPPASPPL